MKHALKCAVSTCFILIAIASKSQVVVNFSADDTVVCPGAPVAFTDLSTLPGGASISSYSWSFSGGFASSTTIANPIVYYYTSGFNSVSLTITVTGTGAGTYSKTKTSYIDVVVPSSAEFTFSFPDICNQYIVAFTNTSTAGDAAITSYLWDFDDGTFSTSINPTKTFTSTGTYDVILFITDGNGCSDNYTFPVTVSAPLSSSISVTGSTFSCGTSITPTISATTSGGDSPYSYSWDYGNGTTGTSSSSAVTYTDCGTYDITYTVTDNNGCTVTNTYNDYVTISCPVADFSMSDDTICQGTAITFTNLSDPGASSYYWQYTFPGASPSSAVESPTYTYTGIGTKYVKLTTTWPGGCTASHFDTVNIVAKPTIGGIMATDTFGCAVPFTTTLSAYGISGTGPFTYTWTIDGTTYTEESPTVTLNETINYDVTLVITDANGCSSTLNSSGFIKIKKPVTDISATPLTGCAPLEVTFTNASSSVYVPLDYFVWNYDDGNIDTLYTTGDHTYTFTATDNYHVEMTLYTVDGCPKTASINIEVGEPIAYFEFETMQDTTCNPISIDNQSIGSDVTTVDWGDGFEITLDTPTSDTTHFYLLEDTATYYVVLTAEDHGCVSTWTDTITVLPAVNAISSSWDCSEPTSLTIDIDTNYVIGSYCLVLGTDTICDIPSITYDFGVTGIIAIEIIPLDGLTEEQCAISTNYYGLIPSINPSFVTSPTALCDTGTVTFTSTSTVEYTAILNYTWQIGPGLSTGITDTYTTSLSDYTYTFTDDDIYPITLTVTDIHFCTYTLYDTVVVGGPTAYFLVDSIIGCSPKKLFLSDSSYTAMSDSYITEWEWDYDGLYPDYSGEFPPPKNFPNGIWDVTLTVEDNMGCTDDYVQTFDFSNVLTASFISDSLACNPGEHLNFVNTTSGEYTSIEWDYGDGTIDTISVDGDHLYTSEGFYTVTLTVSDSLGCTSIHADSFYIQFDSLVASFDLNYLVVASCPPIPVQLINTSTGDILDFYWEVERETGTFTYTLDTLLFTYTLPGSYDVNLIVSTTNGCVDTISGVNSIDIPGPVGTMTFSPDSGCLPLAVSFDIEGLDADLAYIDFGDGDTTLIVGDYSYSYFIEGTFYPSLILIDSTGCFYSVTSSTSVSTYSSPLADFSISDTSVCLGDSITIIDLSTIVGTTPTTTYTLDLGDGTVYTFTSGFDSIIHTYTDIGSYTITLTESNPTCSDTISKTVLVNTYPSATFAYSPMEGCIPLTVDFTLTGVSAADILIDFGDSTTAYITGDTSYTYTSAGSYIPSITLNSVSGCSQPIIGTDTIEAYDPPSVAITLSDSSICEGSGIAIFNTDTSVLYSPAINYTIDFGDGTSVALSAFDSITHTYTTAGIHLVTAIADNGFCTDTASVNLNVNDIPSATMSYAPLAGCYDLAVVFSFSGLVADTMTLDFGDGTSAYISGDTTYTYTLAGSYVPSLTLNNASGCNQSIIGVDTIQVFDIPVAAFSVSDSSICEGSSISIYNTDATVYALPVNYTIDFGDGTSTTLTTFDSISHTYISVGTNTIILTIDNGYCHDSTFTSVLVNDIPSATMTYSPLEGCNDLMVDFTFTGLVADTITLGFGDGTFAAVTGPVSHIYSATGDYIPSITLNNASGCNQSITGTDTIHIYDTPIAGVDVSDTVTCEGGSITIYNTSDETVVSPAFTYTLDYGDGSAVSTFTTFDSISHVYSLLGLYTITLVADNGFCSDTAYSNITINDAPAATISYTPFDGCFDHTVNFSFTGLVADTVTLFYGDGNSDIITGDVTYTYTVAGNYMPTVTLENITGCDQTGIGADTIHVYDTPVASIATNDSIVCEGSDITIYNTATASIYSSPITYTIDFGDGTSTTLSAFDSIIHTYTTAGTPVISVVADNGFCADSASLPVVINDIPSATMDYTPLAGCINLPVDFSFTGLVADTITLHFGDGSSAVITGPVSHVYSSVGSYLPFITLNNISGCNQSFAGIDSIYIYDIPVASISVSDPVICEGTPITVYNTDPGGLYSPTITYELDFGDGATTTLLSFDSITHTFTSPSTYTIMLVSDNGYCSDTTYADVLVNDVPSATMDYTPLEGCTDLVVDFTFTGLIADAITLDFGDGTSATITGDVSHTYPSTGTYIPTVDLTNLSGCDQSITGIDTIKIYDVPVAAISTNDSSICEGGTITIFNESPGGLYSPSITYTIDFGDGTSTTTTTFSSINHTYTSIGTPVISVVANNGFCADSTALPILIDDIPSATMDYDPLLGCENLTVDFNFTGLIADDITLFYGDGNSSVISGDVSYTYPDPGKYVPYVELNNLTGCNQFLGGTDTIIIHFNPVADMVLSDSLLCLGTSLTITDASWDTTFSPILTYTLDCGDGSPVYSGSSLSSLIHTYTTEGIYTIEMFVSNAGCSDSLTKVIEIAPIPSATLDIVPTTGCASVLTDFVLSSISADSMFINTGTTTMLVSGTTAFLYDVPGVYYPSIELVDMTGCTATLTEDSIVVSWEPLANMIVTDSMPYCSGDIVYVLNLSDNPTTDPVINPIDQMDVYANGTSIFSGAWFDSVEYNFSLPGDYNFMMIVSNEWGCVDTVTSTFIVHEKPLAVAGADDLLCPGLSIDLDGTSSSGGSYYSWSPAGLLNDPTISSPSGTFDATTTMTLVYSNDYCSDTDQVVISVLDDLELTAWPDAEICVGESVQLYSNYNSSGGDVQVLWLQGDYLSSTIVSDPISTPLNTITYTVQATCGDLVDYGDVTITVFPLPTVTIEDTATMILEEPISLTATAAGEGTLSYTWTPADYLNCTTCPTVITNATSDIVYFVNVVDENGCNATDSIYLRVVWNCAGEGIEVANIITPNNDGINDRFQFRTEAVKELFYFNIYNRWGELMFSSNDPVNAWDGTFNGKACDPGVYIYTIKGICFDDEEFIKSGNVTLVR
ncbi:MAG: PKD domain-containing protein [Chitinophagales bacterium]